MLIAFLLGLSKFELSQTVLFFLGVEDLYTNADSIYFWTTIEEIGVELEKRFAASIFDCLN